MSSRSCEKLEHRKGKKTPRYGEQQLEKDIRGCLESWGNEISQCEDRIFLSVGHDLRPMLLDALKRKNARKEEIISRGKLEGDYFKRETSLFTDGADIPLRKTRHNFFKIFFFFYSGMDTLNLVYHELKQRHVRSLPVPNVKMTHI
jgi:hypothetical protein